MKRELEFPCLEVRVGADEIDEQYEGGNRRSNEAEYWSAGSVCHADGLDYLTEDIVRNHNHPVILAMRNIGRKRQSYRIAMRWTNGGRCVF